MDAGRQTREERKRELLRELAELQVEEMVEAGTFDQTPHFSVIERATSQLGKEVLRETRERAARELVSQCPLQVACPTCGAICETTTQRRTVSSMEGPIELTESVADCRRCRRSFFPSADGVGF
jgi:hypothetical protein